MQTCAAPITSVMHRRPLIPITQTLKTETTTYAYPTHTRYTESPEAARHGAGLVRADDAQRRTRTCVRGAACVAARPRGTPSREPAHDALAAARATQIPRRGDRGPRLPISH